MFQVSSFMFHTSGFMFHASRFMIIGHQTQWEFLKKSFELGKLSHAYLFSGEKRLGKKKVALEFVKMLFGPESAQEIERGTHPDFVMIEPGEGNLIQIAQIRKLNSYFSFRPSLAPLKAAIIDDAHRMNSAAQSALLKLLEEPKGFTIFILISFLPHRLLPTIISRTQIVNFYRVPAAEAKKYLDGQKISGKTSELLLSLYDGRPGDLLKFLSDPEKLREQEEWAGEADKLIGSDLPFRFKYAENLNKNPQKIDEVLDFWLRYFREMLLSCSEEDEFRIKLGKILHRIQTVKTLISSTNVNPRLALEVLMLEL